jgi:Cys-tRNA(Pro)/Cys-tRNA(Cys) deacylase
MKTNAARILDLHKIKYRIATYEVDESDLRATTVAHKVGMPPEQVYKTLLVRGDKTGPLFAMIAANQSLSLKALAQASRNKKVEMVPLKEVLPLTGYIRGGVSPIGAKKSFPVFLDETVILFEEIAFSAGARGAQIITDPENLKQLLDLTVAAIGQESGEQGAENGERVAEGEQE